MLIFGVDPGKTGAFIALDESGKIIKYWPASQLLNAVTMATCFEERLWVVEAAQAMPKNGAVSMFNYGTGYGRILGALEASGMPYQLVRSAKWTKDMLAGIESNVEGKERNIRAARNLQPDFIKDITKRTKPDMGLVDAYLIAEWGRRHYVVGEMR